MELESLKQLHIIPRTPSPSLSPPPSRSASPGVDDAEDNAAGRTPAEEQLLKALLAKMNKGRGGSGGAAGGNKRKTTRIKKEQAERRGLGVRAAKRARKGPPVTIDLTGEDNENVDVEENELFVS